MATDASVSQNLEIPAEVRTFIDGLLTDAGVAAMDDQMKEEMVKELFVRLDNYIATVIVEYLPSEHFDEFIKMNEEKKSKEEVEKFLQEKVPSVQEVFAKAFADFRTMYLGNVAVSRNAPAKDNAKPN